MQDHISSNWIAHDISHPTNIRTSIKNRDEGDFPVIIRANMRDPSTFFLAQQFPMKDKDILYVSNADSVELLKVLNIISSATSGVSGPAADAVTVRDAVK